MGIKLQISFPYLPQSDIVKTKGYVNEWSINMFYKLKTV